jgi:tubulin-specific chaperone A
VFDHRIKQITVKTGVLKRVGKEKLSYRIEADQQKVKLQKMKDDGKDEYDIRKMNEVLQETLMMIPDCHRRLVAAHADIKNVLASEADLAEDDKYIAALAQITEAEEQMKIE